MNKGLIQLYTGGGKGKTTASFGLALRAIGNDFSVLCCQFLKGSQSGEHILQKMFPLNFQLKQIGILKTFYFNMNDDEKININKIIKQGFNELTNLISKQYFDLLILDEFTYILNYQIISYEDFFSFIDNKPDNLEIIITGRDAEQKLIERCDLVSEINKIRHPFDRGINARKGIEF